MGMVVTAVLSPWGWLGGLERTNPNCLSEELSEELAEVPLKTAGRKETRRVRPVC